MKKIRNLFKILQEIPTLLLSVKEKEEPFDPLNIISNVVNFLSGYKKMVLKLLSPTCMNNFQSMVPIKNWKKLSPSLRHQLHCSYFKHQNRYI